MGPILIGKFLERRIPCLAKRESRASCHILLSDSGVHGQRFTGFRVLPFRSDFCEVSSYALSGRTQT